MSIENRIRALEERHAQLDRAIEDMEHRPHYTPEEMSQLKRQKLALKDEISILRKQGEAAA